MNMTFFVPWAPLKVQERMESQQGFWRLTQDCLPSIKGGVGLHKLYSPSEQGTHLSLLSLVRVDLPPWLAQDGGGVPSLWDLQF